MLRDLATDHRIALVTNTSQDLAERAAAKLGIEVDVLVSAERAGFYKPRPEPYRAGMVVGQPALFVAGSAGDVPGAEAVGLPVIWHNRVGAPAAGGDPLAVIETLPAAARARSLSARPAARTSASSPRPADELHRRRAGRPRLGRRAAPARASRPR